MNSMAKHAKRRVYQTPTGRRQWTQEEDDLLLEAVVKATNAARLDGTFDRLAVQLGHASQGRKNNLGDPCNRRAWGLANRLAEYTPGPTRTQRDDAQPATYGELWLVKTAALSDSWEAFEGRPGLPDAAYVAGLVGRSPTWADTMLKHFDPRRGFKGLGLQC